MSEWSTPLNNAHRAQRLSLEKKLLLMDSRLTTCGNTDKNSILSSIV